MAANGKTATAVREVKEVEAETLEQARERLAQERLEAEAFGDRYGLEFVDMTRFRIDNDLFRRIPFELMLRYGFIPEEQLDGRLSVIMADPSDVVKIDEMLGNVSDLLDDQVETRMARLLSLVEPMMLVFMGLIIGLLLVSIYLPMFSALGSSKF